MDVLKRMKTGSAKRRKSTIRRNRSLKEEADEGDEVDETSEEGTDLESDVKVGFIFVAVFDEGSSFNIFVDPSPPPPSSPSPPPPLPPPPPPPPPLSFSHALHLLIKPNDWGFTMCLT